MFVPNYNSLYKKYANQSLDWCPMDTEILYDKNYKERFELLESNGWLNSKFKYTFNSHGFRCDEFTEHSTIMFLGCSHTMGIGLPIETVWSSIVAKKLNMHYANLAIGGSASDTAFRLCHGWIDKVKPKIVIFLEPPGFRIELVNDHHSNIINVNNTAYLNFIKEWNYSDDNTYFNSQKNQLAIKALCQDRKIDYFHFKSSQLTDYALDLARDLAHSGPKTHQCFADYVVDKINRFS